MLVKEVSVVEILVTKQTQVNESINRLAAPAQAKAVVVLVCPTSEKMMEVPAGDTMLPEQEHQQSGLPWRRLACSTHSWRA